MNAITPTEPTAVEVLSRLKAAHLSMGCEGRFALTYSVGEEVECYVTHWFRPPYSLSEDCKAVGQGTVRQCLDAAERFAATYVRQRPLTTVEVGMVLGIVEVSAPAVPGLLYAAE